MYNYALDIIKFFLDQLSIIMIKNLCKIFFMLEGYKRDLVVYFISLNFRNCLIVHFFEILL